MTFKLICFDMDGIIFKDINFWMELHKKFGTFEEGKIITEKYLHTDYNKLVEEVVGRLWKGRDAKVYFELVNSIEYINGVEKVFDHVQENGYLTAVISASTVHLARRAQRKLCIDHIFTNGLVIKNGKASGDFFWPIGAGKDCKAKIIQSLCDDYDIDLSEVIYVGDSDTDIEAFKLVGTSIAFNGSDKLKEIATHIVDSDDLNDIIKFIN